MSIFDYKNNKPVFLPEQWFVGKFVADGAFFARSGALKRGFHMELEGRDISSGGQIVTELVEHLKYNDGEENNRTYRIVKVADGRYEATAGGVVGTAEIQASGNALHWKYKLKQLVSGSEWTLGFDDWMYLNDENTMVDRAEVYKFGITVGEVFLVAKRIS